MRCGARKEGAGVARHAGKRERRRRRGDDTLVTLAACLGARTHGHSHLTPLLRRARPSPEQTAASCGPVGWYGTAFSRGAGPKHRGPAGRGTHRRRQSWLSWGSRVTPRSPPDTPGLSLGWQKDQQAVAHGALGPGQDGPRCSLTALPRLGWSPRTCSEAALFSPQARGQKQPPSP